MTMWCARAWSITKPTGMAIMNTTAKGKTGNMLEASTIRLEPPARLDK
jgi:hypothetical protein